MVADMGSIWSRYGVDMDLTVTYMVVYMAVLSSTTGGAIIDNQLVFGLSPL